MLGIGADVGPVERAVRAHDRPDMGLLDDGLEGRVVDLRQRSRRYGLVELDPVRLLVVDGEVFGVGDHPLRLDAVDVGHAHDSGQVRILSVGLERPAALGYPGQVELGTLDDVESLSRGPRRLRPVPVAYATAGSKLAATPMAAGSWVTPLAP